MLRLFIHGTVACFHMSYVFNPLYTGRLFHGYMLDDVICRFRGVRPIFLFLSNFDEILLANTADPDQTAHDVASDLGLH